MVFTNAFLICGLNLMHEDRINVHIFSCFESVFSTYCSEISFNSQQGDKQNVRKVYLPLIKCYFTTSQYIDCL